MIIDDLEYLVHIGDKYAFLDSNGNILSPNRYDDASITSYGDSFFKTYKIGEKSYFYFEGKIYGPYDSIDTLNTFYGFNPSSSSGIKGWSIFTEKNGKTYIVSNGKEFSL
jgi:hypothetical protein